MGYECPQCGKKIGRATPSSSVGAAMGGAIFPVLCLAFTFSFHCPECVKDFSIREMPEGTLAKALLGSLVALSIAAGIIVLVFVYLLPNL